MQGYRTCRSHDPFSQEGYLSLCLSMLMANVGCDPKYFFGDLKSYASEINTLLPKAQVSEPLGLRAVPTPISLPLTRPLWSPVSPVQEQKQTQPKHEQWGIIPSRSIMITNLPKSTQLWTLVELLKVLLPTNPLISGSR